MRARWTIVALLGFGLAYGGAEARSRRAVDTVVHPPVVAQVTVCFVPAQECDAAVVTAIAGAKHTIRVQAYGFTAPAILNALAAARAAGVDVQAVLDKSNEAHENANPPIGAAFTAAANIPTWIDNTVAIAHNKVIVVDEMLVIGGSYNYTSSAERRNAENVTFTYSPELARLYLDNWESRKALSRPSRLTVGSIAEPSSRVAAAR
jgi:phospholipase D